MRRSLALGAAATVLIAFFAFEVFVLALIQSSRWPLGVAILVAEVALLISWTLYRRRRVRKVSA